MAIGSKPGYPELLAEAERCPQAVREIALAPSRALVELAENEIQDILDRR